MRLHRRQRPEPDELRLSLLVAVPGDLIGWEHVGELISTTVHDAVVDMCACRDRVPIGDPELVAVRDVVVRINGRPIADDDSFYVEYAVDTVRAP